MSSAGNWGAPSWHSLAAQYKVPTTQAQLYQGVASAAVDPTSLPTSPNPTSMARLNLPGATAAQMGDTAGALTTNNTAEPAGVTAPPSSGLLAQSLMAQPTSRAAVSNPALTAPARGPAQTAASQVQYGGAQVVATPSLNGMYRYYQYDAATGGYKYLGEYNPVTKKGGVAGYTTQTGNVSFDSLTKGGTVAAPTAAPTGYTGYYNYSPDQAQLDNATYLGPLGPTSPTDQYGVGAVDNFYKGDRDKYADQITAANAEMANNARNSQISIALDWMENHGGAAPPGGNLSPDVIAEAQAQYQAQMGGEQRINGADAMAPINTSAADAASEAVLRAHLSGAYNMFGGSDNAYTGRFAGAQAQALADTGAVNHQEAAAASFNTNLKAFTDAVTAQAQVDTSATGAKLNQDIMQIGDALNSIAQAATQLGAEGQQNVNTAVAELQSAMNQYQQAVQQHGVNSAQALALAKGILKGAASLTSGGATQIAKVA